MQVHEQGVFLAFAVPNLCVLRVGHIGFFGAICHPELAFIEQCWAHLKDWIRPMINDTDAGLVVLIHKGFREIITSLANCADARHCRDAMHAYRFLRTCTALVDPNAVEAHMRQSKTHRVPFASATVGIILLAGIVQSNAAIANAAKTVVRREQNAWTVEKCKKDTKRNLSLKRKLNNERASDKKRLKERQSPSF